MTAPRTVSTAASAASAAPIASSISLATAPVGTPIEHMVVALIKKKLGQTKAGDPMLTLEFGDADGGRIGAKVWKQDVPTWDAISEGMAVTVTGKVKAGFQGGPPEFSIERVGEAFAAHPVLEGMLPKYEGDLGELRKRFLAIISTIEHPGLLKFVRAVFKDACPFEAFTAAPAALGHHHAMKHGLLLHTTQVAENALHLAQTPEYAPHVQRDLLAAQAVLHDIGKVEEITTSPVGFSFSLKGRLYGHVVSGLLMLERTWTAHRAELEPLGMSESIMEHLRHGIASHHGQKEWGASAVRHRIHHHRTRYIRRHVRKSLTAPRVRCGTDAGAPRRESPIRDGRGECTARARERRALRNTRNTTARVTDCVTGGGASPRAHHRVGPHGRLSAHVGRVGRVDRYHREPGLPVSGPRHAIRRIGAVRNSVDDRTRTGRGAARRDDVAR
jgi:3'-5' exoribonuclease